jgi:DNA-binding protein YbaB
VTTSAQPQDAVQEAVASFKGRIAELRAQTEAAQAALTEVTASGASPDGSVRVTVDCAGVLTGIEFGRLAGSTPEQLAAYVLAAVHDARVAVLDRARESVIERVGPDNPAVTVLAARAAALRAESPAAYAEAPPGRAEPVAAASGAPDTEDVGFAGRGR